MMPHRAPFQDARRLEMSMPAPLTPLAWTAIRLGTVALVAAYAARRRASQPKDAEHEWVLDRMPEGVEVHSHRAESETAVHGAGRLRRVIRFGIAGPGLEIDGALLGRLRFRRVPRDA